MFLAGHGILAAQPQDSLQSRQVARSAHSPTGALWRSAIVPGLGQIYNRQPVKAPIVVGALTGLVVLAVHNDNRFDTYNHAYLYGVYIDEDPHPFPQYEADYLRFPGVSTGALRSRRDAFKRNRDLTIIGIVVAYAFNLLDAYVSGHLVDFDVGEDLSVSDPLLRPGLSASIRYRF